MTFDLERQSVRFTEAQLARKRRLGDAVWDVFTVRLGAYLTTMFEDNSNMLTLESPRMSEGHRDPVRMRFWMENRTHIHVEMSGSCVMSQSPGLDEQQTRQLAEAGWSPDDQDPPAFSQRVVTFDALWAAQQVSEAVRDQYCLPDPGLLSVLASGPAAGGVPVLGLPQAANGQARPMDPPASVIFIEDREEFVHALQLQLSTMGRTPDGASPALDEDGDLVLTHDGRRIWIRVLPDQPAIQMMTVVIPEVISRRQAAVEVNQLNTRAPWSRWTLQGRSVWQICVIPARPFIPATFHDILTLFLADLDHAADKLNLRLRGDA